MKVRDVDTDTSAMSARGIREAVSSRAVSPIELVESLLERIDAVNPRLNAYCTVATERARRQAAQRESALMRREAIGALHGVPVAFKDLTDTAGVRTTYGSMAFRDHVPRRNALVVQRALKAGAILMGKTNTPEFGCRGVTDNLIFGPTRNPWDLDRTAGGSSGGSAAAVSAGLAYVAEGSDLGGSIRIPASFCGVVGYKPTTGLIPDCPSLGGWRGFWSTGALARTVDDAALFVSAVAGPAPCDPRSVAASQAQGEARRRPGKRIRVAWSVNLGDLWVSPDIEGPFLELLSGIHALGWILEEALPPVAGSERLFIGLTALGRARALRRHVENEGDEVDPALLRRVRLAQTIGIDERRSLRNDLLTYQARMAAFFDSYDVLLTPSVAVAAFDLGLRRPPSIQGAPEPTDTSWAGFGFPFNLTGAPAMSLPIALTGAGLPVGVQLVAQVGDDARLLKIARTLENVSGWPALARPMAIDRLQVEALRN